MTTRQTPDILILTEPYSREASRKMEDITQLQETANGIHSEVYLETNS